MNRNDIRITITFTKFHVPCFNADKSCDSTGEASEFP